MKLVHFNDIEWEYDPEGNFHFGYNKNLPANEFGDVAYAKISGKETLATHFHDRPDPTGYICFYFFNGGNIKIILPDEEDQIIKSDKPFHVTFEHMEKHGMENLSENEVIFEIISAPRYVENEEIRV